VNARPPAAAVLAAGDAAALPQVACPLCRQNGASLYSDLEDISSNIAGRWVLRVCGHCRIAWLDPRLPQIDFDRAYRNYFAHSQVEPDSGRKRTRRKIKDAAMARLAGLPLGGTPWVHRIGAAVALHVPRYRELVQAATLWLSPAAGGNLLDVGCGDGSFMKRMRDLGWRVRGIDPNRWAVEQARKCFGLEVEEARLEDHRFPENSFDAAVAGHVVEHAYDPISFLKECRRVLKPGGKLVALTPNYLGLQRRWLGRRWLGLDCPRHLYLFSRRSLRRCCELAGLEVLVLRTTAREAKNFWRLSRARGGPSRDPVERGPLAARIAALAYDWIERSALLFWPDAGGEILLIARK
jgi:2-polyprenyl-3-methyl-5-hydroxy-6-metoxy-1,4-benzoquinol methylase